MRALRGRDGKMGSECILSHVEEQHVHQDVARFAVKCGMWGVVKNMDGGFRKFQRERRARATASAAGLGYPAAQQIDRVGGGGSRGGKGEILRRLAMGAAVSASVGVLAAMDASHRGRAKRIVATGEPHGGAFARAVVASPPTLTLRRWWSTSSIRGSGRRWPPGSAAAAVGGDAAGEPGWSGATATKTTQNDTLQT